jgi:hypothetical protein
MKDRCCTESHSDDTKQSRNPDAADTAGQRSAHPDRPAQAQDPGSREVEILDPAKLSETEQAAAATVLTSAMPTVEAATPILTLIYFPVIIVSGVLGSISEPHWLTTFAGYLPAKPLIDAATSALSHSTGGLSLPAHDLVVLAVWTVVGLAVAVVTFRWEPHRPTRRGAARPAKTPVTA